jgi:hypothetical protein
MLLYKICSVYSQTDSLLLKNFEQKILENGKLQTELQNEVQKNLDLSNAYKKDTLALQKQIKELRNEVSSEKQKVSALNKNKIKEERDKLLTEVNSLNIEISTLNQTIAEKDIQIADEKAKIKTIAEKAKKDGETEAITAIVTSYESKTFDELINSSSKESVQRDIQLVGNDVDIKQVLNDLQIYFEAKELLGKKYDNDKIKDAQTQLNRIKRESVLLDKFKKTVDLYQTFNDGLEDTIRKLVKLDNDESVEGLDDETQNKKFYKIMSEISTYIFGYDFNFIDYPYLSDIVLEIIKRKQPNADADISNLVR